MSKLITTATLLLLIINLLNAQDNATIVIGTKHTLHSDQLNEDREFWVGLPDSYHKEDSTKKYPVLILLDGYTHFKTVTGIVHFMSSDRNRNYFIPEMIVVAIENVDRERDFTVTKIKIQRPNTMGGGRNFLKFIEKELIPYIDKNYSTEPSRILVGHSLGGLLTLHSYMDESSVFDAFIALDPSIWWDEQLMKEKVDSIPATCYTKKFYLATANQGEANYERNKQRHDVLNSLIKQKAPTPVLFKVDYFENESHRSVPLIGIYEGLKYLFIEQNE